jgi:polyhydroxyalkanoate synthesis regulator phasin
MKRIAVAALAVVLVGAALIGGSIGLAVAQDEDTPVQSFLGRVAEKLGIGEDELRSAVSEVEQDIIDERVAEGNLTEEQGERLKERIQEGDLLGPGFGPLEGPRERFCDRVFDCIRDRVRDHLHERDGRLTVEAAATVLGLEPEELLSELKDGKTLAEVADGQGMPVGEFTAAMLAQVQQELDALVAEGTLTQEQADAIYDRVEENIDRIVNASPGPPGFGPPGHGPGGFGGPCLGPAGEEPDTAAPSEVTA